MALTPDTGTNVVRVLNQEYASVTREFDLLPPVTSQGAQSVQVLTEVTDGDGASGPTVDVDIQYQRPDGGWANTAAANISGSGRSACRWFPRLRAVATITASSGIGAPVAASNASALTFAYIPSHGDVLELSDGITRCRVAIAWYTTKNAAGAADASVVDRPQDGLWYLPITGQPGDTSEDDATSITACRDALLTLLGTLKTDGYFRMTAAANGGTRVNLTHDVPGAAGNVSMPTTASGAIIGSALTGGSGTATAVSIEAYTA